MGIENLNKVEQKEQFYKEINIEEIKEAAKELNDDPKFKALRESFIKLAEKIKDFEQAAEEMKKGGSIDENWIIAAQKKYSEDMEEIESVMIGMVLEKMGAKVKSDVPDAIDEMFADIMKSEGDESKDPMYEIRHWDQPEKNPENIEK